MFVIIHHLNFRHTSSLIAHKFDHDFGVMLVIDKYLIIQLCQKPTLQSGCLFRANFQYARKIL